MSTSSCGGVRNILNAWIETVDLSRRAVTIVIGELYKPLGRLAAFYWQRRVGVMQAQIAACVIERAVLKHYDDKILDVSESQKLFLQL